VSGRGQRHRDHLARMVPTQQAKENDVIFITETIEQDLLNVKTLTFDEVLYIINYVIY